MASPVVSGWPRPCGHHGLLSCTQARTMIPLVQGGGEIYYDDFYIVYATCLVLP